MKTYLFQSNAFNQWTCENKIRSERLFPWAGWSDSPGIEHSARCSLPQRERDFTFINKWCMRLLPVIGDSDMASFPGESRTYWEESGLPGLWDLVMCYCQTYSSPVSQHYLRNFIAAHFLQPSVTSDMLCTHIWRRNAEYRSNLL